MDIKRTAYNRDIQLAAFMGYESGLGDRVEFQFPSLDKAWNDCWLLIKDEARQRGWVLHSKDEIERWFKEGFRRGKEKAEADKQLT